MVCVWNNLWLLFMWWYTVHVKRIVYFVIEPATTITLQLLHWKLITMIRFSCYALHSWLYITLLPFRSTFKQTMARYASLHHKQFKTKPTHIRRFQQQLYKRMLDGYFLLWPCLFNVHDKTTNSFAYPDIQKTKLLHSLSRHSENETVAQTCLSKKRNLCRAQYSCHANKE